MCRHGRAPRTLPHLGRRACACEPTFRGRVEPVCSRSTAASSGSLRYAHGAVLRSVSTFAWSRVLPLLALPGCLVSFNDYPLGDPQAEPANESSSDHGGASTAGASVLPRAGSASGGTITVAMGHTGGQDAMIGGTSAGSNPLLIDDFEDGDPAILVQQ